MTAAPRYTGLKAELIPAAKLAENRQQHANHLVAVVSYGNVAIDQQLTSALQVNINLPQLADQQLVEIWTSDAETRQCKKLDIEYRANPHMLIGFIQADEKSALEHSVFSAYQQVLDLIQEEGYPHLIRTWNYFAGINDQENGRERYQSFCTGRQQAYTEANFFPQQDFPAATVIGTASGSFTLYFLASREPGLHCENPRQISAYHYPRQYGPVSPSFSRALLQTGDQQQLLYLSGTASIIGHASIHLNDPVQQTMEIAQNIRTLIEHANNTYKTAVSRHNARMLKVYIRDREHYLTVKNTVEQQFGKHTPILYLQGDICRQDLLVEIEGLFE